MTPTIFHKPYSACVSSIDYFHCLNTHFDGTLNDVSAFSLATINDTNDAYTFSEMLRQDDVPEFVHAMIKEINDHKDRDHWDLINWDEISPGTKTILAIWSFKHKRKPDGEMVKWKSRFCYHGVMQQWGLTIWRPTLQ